VGEKRKIAQSIATNEILVRGRLPFQLTGIKTYIGWGSDGDLLERSTTIGQVYNEWTARKNISAFPGDAT
jgi:hypothetical protein